MTQFDLSLDHPAKLPDLSGALAMNGSPDGQLLAYIDKEEATFRLVIHNRRARVDTVILVSQARLNAPRWSPDGKRLYYTRAVRGLSKIFVWENERHRQLTFGSAIDTDPVEANHRVYFSSNRSGGVHVHYLAPDGVLAQVTHEDGSLLPQATPNGKTLFYLQQNTEGAAVMKMDMSTGLATSIHQKDAIPAMTLSPDGKRLLIATTKQLLMMNDHGQVLQQRDWPDVIWLSWSGSKSWAKWH